MVKWEWKVETGKEGDELTEPVNRKIHIESRVEKGIWNGEELLKIVWGVDQEMERKGAA